ncbi:sulfotransferase [Zhengella sp. ZM62]|uniref:sulfotransferase n=1 Tax=Zhengella sedimenti TaxID=3390035 RepID=UPI0039756B74
MKRTKVFVVGAPKTGTTTAATMLNLLGYRTSSWPVYRLFHCLQKRDLKALMAEIDAHDAFEDLPWTVLYRVVDQACPGSKFILTVRNEDKWIRSMVSYNGFWPDPARRFLMGLAAPAGFEGEHRAWYRRHNASVIEWFRDRPSDLLVVDWESGQGWNELCAFLGCTPPGADMPHARRTNHAGLAARMFRLSAGPMRLLRRIGPVNRRWIADDDRFDPERPWIAGPADDQESMELWKPGLLFRLGRAISARLAP